MLGLLLIYFVGKKFYDLAFEYDRSRWGFAIAGVVCYYAFTFICAFVIALFIEINSPGYITDSNEIWIGMLGIPFGILACWGLYKILENSWIKARAQAQPNTLDSGMIDNSNTRYR